MVGAHGLKLGLLQRVMHRLTGGVFIWVCLAWAAVPTVAAAEVPEEVLRSVVLLSGPGFCASGFLTTQGQIVTAAHVTSGLCPNGKCEELTIRTPYSEKYMRGQPIIIKPRLKLEVPSLDLAVLEWPEKPLLVGKIALGKSKGPGSKIYQLGYPSCSRPDITVNLQEGRIQSESRFEIWPDTVSWRGGSGGPVLNENFEAIGVHVRRSQLFDEFLRYLPGGKPMAAGVASRTESLSKLLTDDLEKSIEAEFELLNSYFESELAQAKGIRRGVMGLGFQRWQDKAVARASTATKCGNLKNLLLWRLVDEGYFPRLNKTECPSLTQAAIKFQIYGITEDWSGLLKEGFASINEGLRQDAIQPKLREELKPILDRVSSQMLSPGALLILGTLVAALVAAFFSGLLFCWGALRTGLSRSRRFACAVLLGLLPLAVFVGAFLLMSYLVPG